MNIKKLLLTLCILLTCSQAGKCQTMVTVEDYDAIIARFQRYYNLQYADSIYDLFSPSFQARQPLSETKEKIGRMYTKFAQMLAFHYAYQKEGVTFYAAAFNNTTMTLMITFDQQNKFETFRLSSNSGITDTTKSNFWVKVANGNVYGTLTQPKGTNKIPVVMIIPGFGNTDKDGNGSGYNGNTYKMLSDSLVNRGYACLRYDKRGVGQSAAALPSEEDLTFDLLIDDAIALARRLKQYWRFNKVIILGHSEGSLVGMKVADSVKVSGYISAEGLAQRADKKIEQQLKNASKQLSSQAKKGFDSLKKGYTVHPTDTMLRQVFNNTNQKYLRTWIKYDPKKEIHQLTMPVMIIQGANDMEVSVKEANTLKKGNKQAQVTIIDSMNFLLKPVAADNNKNFASYNDKDLALSPELVPAIVAFINSLP